MTNAALERHKVLAVANAELEAEVAHLDERIDNWIDVAVAMPEANRCVLALADEPGAPDEPQVCPVVAFYVPIFGRWMISKPHDTRPMTARILAWRSLPDIPSGWLRIEATGRGGDGG